MTYTGVLLITMAISLGVRISVVAISTTTIRAIRVVCTEFGLSVLFNNSSIQQFQNF